MNHQTYYMFLLGSFATVAYVMYVDRNVAEYIVLLCKIVGINLRRLILFFKLYPRLRLETALLRWRSKNILKTPKYSYNKEGFDGILGRVEKLETVVSELKQTIDVLQNPEYNLSTYTLDK